MTGQAKEYSSRKKFFHWSHRFDFRAVVSLPTDGTEGVIQEVF